MKKLGNGTGRKVHPAPPQDHLGALPAAVLTLAAALTAEEQEVLAYLLSGGGRWREQRQRQAHPPELGCGCFGCYKSFWARWDASPNRHVIHNIIDAVEESLETRERDRGVGGRRHKQSGRGGGRKAGTLYSAAAAAEAAEEGKGLSATEVGRSADDNGDGYDDEGSVDDFDDRDEDAVEDDEDDEEEDEMSGRGDCSNNGNKNSVRRFMSFIGESVWGVWN